LKPEKTITDKILAFWMLILGLHLFSFFIHLQGYWEIYPSLSGIHHPLPLWHGPFLFLYTRFSLRTDQRFTWGNCIHFVPALGFYVYLLPFFINYTAEQKLMINQGLLDDYSFFIALSLVAFVISGVGYAIAANLLINRYQNLIRQNFAFRKSVDLDWLRNFIRGIGLIFIIAITFAVFENWLGIRFGFNTDIIFYSLLILFIFYLGYSGILHQGIFSATKSPDKLVDPQSKAEYKNSGLKEENALHHHQHLSGMMKTQKPYLEPKLSLSTLAAYLDITPNQLSQIINQYEGKNFYDYINEYRIEEFKKRVIEPDNSNLSILAVAFDSGFNSKSSFNQVFKKMEGKTPSQYLKSQRISA
jgi:AraC-like DNA-binding protein